MARRDPIYLQVLQAIGKKRGECAGLLTLVMSPAGRSRLFTDSDGRKQVHIPGIGKGPVTFHNVPVYVEMSQNEVFRVVER